MHCCKGLTMTKTVINRFDLSRLTPNRTIVAIGKRGSGKSVLLRDILYRYRDIPYVIVFSATEDCNSTYTGIVSELFIHTEFSESVLQNVIARQKQIAMQSPDKLASNGVLVVFDDMGYTNFLKSKSLKQLFYNGRHSHITCVLSVQYSLDIPAGIRPNIDIVFCFKENMKKSRERLYQYFFGMFDSIKVFERALDACTNDYKCMVLFNCTPSTKIEDTVFFYKATVRDNSSFQCGSSGVWKATQRWRQKQSRQDAGKDNIVLR